MFKQPLLLLTLMLASITAHAAIIPMNLTIEGTRTGFDPGTLTGSGTGSFNTVTMTLSWDGFNHLSTEYLNAFVDDTAWFNLDSYVGEITAVTCTNNDGPINMCMSVAFLPQLLRGVSVLKNTGTEIILNHLHVFEAVAGSPSTEITIDTTYTFFLAQPVPIPAAAWLFGSALIGLVGIGRKRRA